MQTATTILMVRPYHFGYNIETAQDNAFQKNITLLSPENMQKKVLQEFDNFVQTLRSKNIHVLVIEDTPTPIKPDAIFPNNWFCTFANGTLVTFPMFASNRRLEVREDIINTLQEKYHINTIKQLAPLHQKNCFLEGTGSIIFDHIYKRAYACISERTQQKLFITFCQEEGFTPIYFTAKDPKGKNIYHTNVMMHIGRNYCVICLEAIINDTERQRVIDSLRQTGHEIIAITQKQVASFAGNMLQVSNPEGAVYTCMSLSAYTSLTTEQKVSLEQYSQLLPIDITTIETIGGGSTRCMMAEIFLPTKAEKA